MRSTALRIVGIVAILALASLALAAGALWRRPFFVRQLRRSSMVFRDALRATRPLALLFAVSLALSSMACSDSDTSGALVGGVPPNTPAADAGLARRG